MRVASALLGLVIVLSANADANAARTCRGMAKSEPPSLAPPSSRDVASPFGPRTHPLLRYVRFHSGIDYAAEVGDPVRAAAAGEVVIAATQTGYGKLVTVRHAKDFETTYAQLGRILVRKGNCVAAGAVIGKAGTTAVGAHFHFEVRQSGRFVDPAGFVAIRTRQ